MKHEIVVATTWDGYDEMCMTRICLTCGEEAYPYRYPKYYSNADDMVAMVYSPPKEDDRRASCESRK